MDENTTAQDVVDEGNTTVGPKNEAAWQTPLKKPEEQGTAAEPPRTPEPPTDAAKTR